MTDRVSLSDLSVAAPLADFISREALPGSGIDPDTFWGALSDLVHGYREHNQALLDRRDQLQTELDRFHTAQPGIPAAGEYERFLRDIGYLVPEPDDFQISTDSTDPEITTQAGPQLVVPLSNSRFAINAANARWGSLYDALYGTDAIPEHGDLKRDDAYNGRRGAAVISQVRDFLDEIAPLTSGSHSDATSYRITDDGLQIVLRDTSRARLATPSLLAGYRGPADAPTAVLIATTGCTSRSSSTQPTPLVPRIPPASATSSSSPPSP